MSLCCLKSAKALGKRIQGEAGVRTTSFQDGMEEMKGNRRFAEAMFSSLYTSWAQSSSVKNTAHVGQGHVIISAKTRSRPTINPKLSHFSYENLNLQMPAPKRVVPAQILHCSMNAEISRASAEWEAEVRSLGGCGSARLHALQHLKLKAVVKAMFELPAPPPPRELLYSHHMPDYASPYSPAAHIVLFV